MLHCIYRIFEQKSSVVVEWISFGIRTLELKFFLFVKFLVVIGVFLRLRGNKNYFGVTQTFIQPLLQFGCAIGLEKGSHDP